MDRESPRKIEIWVACGGIYVNGTGMRLWESPNTAVGTRKQNREVSEGVSEGGFSSNSLQVKN